MSAAANAAIAGGVIGAIVGAVANRRSSPAAGLFMGAVFGAAAGAGAGALLPASASADQMPPPPPVPNDGGAPPQPPQQGPRPFQIYFDEDFYALFELAPGCVWQFLQQNFYEQDTSPLLASMRGRPIGVWRWNKLSMQWRWYVTNPWRAPECARKR